jgi:hypothetical protein
MVKLVGQMKTILHKARNFQEAEAWDIEQQIRLTSLERQKIAKLLKVRYYGENTPDVRYIKYK